MDADLLVTGIGDLVTLSGASEKPLVGTGMGDLGAIAGGFVAIKDGRIAAVGEASDGALKRWIAEGGRVIDTAGRTAVPGFVDAHTHLLFRGRREDEFYARAAGATYMEIAGRGGGIGRTVRETRGATLEDLVEGGRACLDLLLSQGSTTVEIKSGYGLSTDSEIRMLEAIRSLSREHPATIVATFLGAHAVPEEFKDDRTGYLDLVVEEMLPIVVERGLAKYCDVFCEDGVFTVEESRGVLEAAGRLGLALKVHADEFAYSGGTKLAAEVGARSADHLNFASPADLAALRESGGVAVLLPGTPFFLLAPQYADARSIIDGGVPVALASDFNPTASISSMVFVMFLACLHMAMKPSEALAATTINAAHALDLNHEVGSLEVGKLGDLVILDVANHRDIPFYVGRDIVTHVVKAGRIVHERQEPLLERHPA